MPSKRRLFQRPTGQRRYRKVFVIAVEGTKTEPQYFSLFNSPGSFVWINCLKGHKGSSPQKQVVISLNIAQFGKVK
jgi:hypothetical protein